MKNWKVIVMAAIIAVLVVTLIGFVIEIKTKKPIRLAEKRVTELRVIEEEARLTYSILKSRHDAALLRKPGTD